MGWLIDRRKPLRPFVARHRPARSSRCAADQSVVGGDPRPRRPAGGGDADNDRRGRPRCRVRGPARVSHPRESRPDLARQPRPYGKQRQRG